MPKFPFPNRVNNLKSLRVGFFGITEPRTGIEGGSKEGGDLTLVVESLNFENPLELERGLRLGERGVGRLGGATLNLEIASLKGGGGLGGCSLCKGTQLIKIHN